METGINNKCKAFTSLEQSKKLAEILPKETADFHFKYYSVLEGWCDIPHYGTVSHIKDLPCWSLAALLDILHDYTLQTNSDETVFVVCDSKKPMISDSYSNPVDACYEMILGLKERSLI